MQRGRVSMWLPHISLTWPGRGWVISSGAQRYVRREVDSGRILGREGDRGYQAAFGGGPAGVPVPGKTRSSLLRRHGDRGQLTRHAVARAQAPARLLLPD